MSKEKSGRALRKGGAADAGNRRWLASGTSSWRALRKLYMDHGERDTSAGRGYATPAREVRVPLRAKVLKVANRRLLAMVSEQNELRRVLSRGLVM